LSLFSTNRNSFKRKTLIDAFTTALPQIATFALMHCSSWAPLAGFTPNKAPACCSLEKARTCSFRNAQMCRKKERKKRSEAAQRVSYNNQLFCFSAACSTS
jgi:hypothetical protein